MFSGKSVMLEGFNEELKEAEAMVKEISEEQVSLLMLKAMAGYPIFLKGRGRGIQLREGRDESVRGLVLSKAQIIKIKQYVSYGLSLPTNLEDVEQYLNYSKELNPNLSPKNFQQLFEMIKEHVEQWSDLESRIKSIGTDLKVFSGNYTMIGEEIVKEIDKMPIMEQLKALEEKEQELQFTCDDEQSKIGLMVLLEELKRDIAMQKEATSALSETISRYRENMDNKIIPRTAGIQEELKCLELNQEIQDLREKVENRQKEIELLDKEYNKMVGYTFWGAIGMIFPPAGVVAWACTGGIYGSKAENIRRRRAQECAELSKYREQLREKEDLLNSAHSCALLECAELSKYREQLREKEDFVGKVVAVRGNMADASVVINEAAAGVKNLETVWKSVEAYVENSIEQLKDVDNSTLLLQFKMRMQSTVNSWSEVGNITAELVALFEEAQREVNVKVRSVKDPGKELQLQRKKLNNAVIKFDMEYLPELKNSMEQLRRSIQKFDNDIENSYLRCIPEMKNLITRLTEAEKIYESSNCTPEIMEKVMEMVQEEKSTMQDTLLEAAKTIHKGTLGLRDDSLKEQMDDAVLMLEDMIKKQAEYAYGILEPELTALAKALESVDATLLEKLDENPFQIVMDLLPKVETIEGLDLTQPEIAAMKAAYETALSVLNRMAGSADILKYMSIHDELKKKYEDLERVFQEAKALCDKLEFHSRSLKNLYQVHEVKEYFIECGKTHEMNLQDLLRQLKEENMEQADEMAACREEVEKGLRDLESARSAWR